MNNNSSPNDNDRKSAASGEDQSDHLSSFATAEVVSPPSVGASIDNDIEATKVPAIDDARVLFIRNGRGRRPSNIL